MGSSEEEDSRHDPGHRPACISPEAPHVLLTLPTRSMAVVVKKSPDTVVVLSHLLPVVETKTRLADVGEGRSRGEGISQESREEIFGVHRSRRCYTTGRVSVSVSRSWSTRGALVIGDGGVTSLPIATVPGEDHSAYIVPLYSFPSNCHRGRAVLSVVCCASV